MGYDQQRSATISNDQPWSAMISNDQQRSATICNDSQRSAMISYLKPVWLKNGMLVYFIIRSPWQKKNYLQRICRRPLRFSRHWVIRRGWPYSDTLRSQRYAWRVNSQTNCPWAVPPSISIWRNWKTWTWSAVRSAGQRSIIASTFQTLTGWKPCWILSYGRSDAVIRPAADEKNEITNPEPEM